MKIITNGVEGFMYLSLELGYPGNEAASPSSQQQLQVSLVSTYVAFQNGILSFECSTTHVFME